MTPAAAAALSGSDLGQFSLTALRTAKRELRAIWAATKVLERRVYSQALDRVEEEFTSRDLDGTAPRAQMTRGFTI